MKRIYLLLLLLAAAGSGWSWQGKPVTGPFRMTDTTTAARPLSFTGKPFSLKPPAFTYNYYQGLGVACKAEFKLEKTTGVPFRFRLGSLQQTDYLEQKPNALKPQP